MNDPDFKKLEEMLVGLIESKAPPGKQQIVDVTKQAMSSVRHFKHVVHAIEKFIMKCKPTHKLHGFFMIDSIVRQSQKKFKHKDVFKPRFSANLKQTLENALRCPPKDRPKIVRVINLWRANRIFDEDLLRSLLQYCRASGLSIDIESVEKAVKGDKADMSLYKSVNKENSMNVKPSSSGSQGSKSISHSQIVPESVLLKNLSTISSDYPKAFTENPNVFSQIQSFIGEKVKQKIEAESKNKIKNILSAGFDYSDEEDYDEEEKNQTDSFSKDKIEKVTESLMKESGIQSELRKIFLQQVGLGDGRNGGSDSRDKKRRRSDSRDRKDSKKDRHRRSRERSHKRRSSTPRHRDDKKEKERKKLGWPLQSKKDHFLISSRTVWLGRLPVNCSESEIKNALADFGVPEKIEVINSRACAYVTMPDRRSAFKIVDKMSKKLEISRKPVKVNWCIGQGLHENKKLNVFWESDYGYHQIPWTELPDSIDQLFEGSYADVDTLPPKFQGLYDEKGKKKKVEKNNQVNQVSSQIPMPIINDGPSIPSGIQIPGFPPGIIPGLTLPGSLSDGQDGSQSNPNLEMLMAAVANSSNPAQAGILGAPLNPALLNTLNAFNVQQLNVNRFPRHDTPLPDQQAAFQQFRGNAPRFRGNSDFGAGFGGQRPFSPRPRANFNGNPQRFNMPDLNKPPPNIADLSGQPLRFAGPSNGNAGGPPLMPMNPNFAQLASFDASIPPPLLPQHEISDEPMDIASPEQPPGV